MRKEWLGVALASLVLAACTTPEPQNTAPPQPAYNGPVVEIPGVEPRYEPINPGTSQDYSVNGKNYRIIKDPSNYSEVGLATWYGEEAQGNRTATGEAYDPDALTAAHPTLPLPSYVRVTNIANGRQIVVRVNDRGPYTPGRIIDLSRAAGDRLNISNNSRVRVDYIKVAPDGTLSGPGTIGTVVAKQSYSLPARPDLSGGSVMSGGSAAASQPVPQQNVEAISNSTLQSSDNMGAPVQSSGFLGAPQPLASGVLESNQPPASAPAVTAAPASAAPAAASPTQTAVGYVVQVGALNDPARAQQLMKSLSQRYGVPGTVETAGNVYRVQLGGYPTRAEAAALQQRLSSDGQNASFITNTRR
ncbi:rare lipoprotein A [Pantoea sp. AN62]|uniref:endolytic peptidoglycan transglycosylase RlpA n=1 Tax=Pantoea TaxID=53335 RepID=UPI000B7F7C6B|nr:MULTISPECIES: endolytic peptidoglycan transglycosylase RlpA [Pantoea]MCQ5472435.1 endolytic peptidoglycan transglycosylase RlpA [Pantoea brenneri]MDU4744925.1 endolytic peptidoglycan transglycosylase RlpA [Pantoea sp.]OXM26715.1 septal ring lytic transglycosylase RlpA [Pantoea sp. AV62]HAI04316.1 endolytic peptidoglycan transglycosylase RlpA [Pantoea sp.]